MQLLCIRLNDIKILTVSLLLVLSLDLLPCQSASSVALNPLRYSPLASQPLSARGTYKSVLITCKVLVAMLRLD